MVVCSSAIKKEIYQVWQGIKKMRQQRFSRSALELARAAGWDTELSGWETRVKTALAALEDCGFIKRGLNQTRVFATSLLVKNMAEASAVLQKYEKFDENDRLHPHSAYWCHTPRSIRRSQLILVLFKKSELTIEILRAITEPRNVVLRE